MSEDHLCFKRLEIKRMPGIDPGFSLELGSGINIIYGPNASGKTTTAKSLAALLWPGNAPQRAELTANFTLDGVIWQTLLFGHDRQCQKGGVPADLPLLPPAEAFARYTLSLHDLLQADNTDFVAAITRESSGGYDVAAAAAATGAQVSIGNRKPKETTDYESAVANVREARRRQEALQQEERELAELEQKLDHARAAKKQVELLSLARQYVVAKQALQAAEERLAVFPNVMARLAADDAKTLNGLTENLETEQESLKDYQRKRDEAQQRLLDCALPKTGIPPGLLTTLRTQGRSLAQLEEQLRAAQRSLTGKKEKCTTTLQHLGTFADGKLLQRVDVSSFRDLATFARQAEILRAQQSALEQMLHQLGAVDAGQDPETLQEGRRLLFRWLRMGEARPEWPGWLPLPLLGVAMIVLVESVLLVFQGLWPFLFVAFLGAGLGVVGLVLLVLTLRREKSPDQYLRQEFLRLDLGQPVAWSEDEVVRKLDELDRQKINADAEAVRLNWRLDLEARLDMLAAPQQQLSQLREQLLEQIGVVPEAARIEDEATLFLLAENINRWQAAVQETAEVYGELTEIEQQSKSIFDSMNASLAQFNYPLATSIEEIMGQVEDLDGRSQRYGEAMIAFENAKHNIDMAVERVERNEVRIDNFFANRSLEKNDHVRLHQCLDRLPEYQNAQREAEAARVTCQNAQVITKEHPTLIDLSLTELDMKRTLAQGQAESIEEIVETISRIKERVAIAKSGNELGDALAQQVERTRELREKREQAYAAAAGGILAEFIQRETTEQTRPAVFRRARALLADITHGRYELLLDEVENDFRAKETSTGMGLALNELSSATRVQLLLAVRLAFVEEQESRVKLPLFFDETLGNSDEERARAIIQTVIDLARQGRQIFYFTAQRDEVDKWQGLADSIEAIETRIIDLAEVRQLAHLARIPLPEQPITLPQVPRPDGMGYREYGTALEVPGIEPAIMDIEAVHLWHLFTESDSLYRMLSNNIRTWGQLKSVVEFGYSSATLIDDGFYEKAALAARVLELTINYWRIGRGKPVDRQVLLDSNQVSTAHVDATADLATELQGDGKALIAALEAGKVSRFRNSKREKLQEYLEEKGYISNQKRLTVNEILMRVKLAHRADIDTGSITIARIEDLVGQVIKSDF